MKTIFELEEECRIAHRALGIRKAAGIAVHADYRRAEEAARALDAATKNPAAVALGRLGGLAAGTVKSDAKARASRRNGKKGGRPRKVSDSQTAET